MKTSLTFINNLTLDHFLTESTKESIASKTLFVVLGANQASMVPFDRIVGRVDDILSNGKDVVVSWEIVDSPFKGVMQELQRISDSELVMRPCAVGRIEDGKVLDYKLSYFYLDL